MKTKDIRDIVLKELPTLLEQDRKWEDNQKVIREMLESIKALNRKYDSTIGALGARWGLISEQSLFDSNFSDGWTKLPWNSQKIQVLKSIAMWKI